MIDSNRQPTAPPFFRPDNRICFGKSGSCLGDLGFNQSYTQEREIDSISVSWLNRIIWGFDISSACVFASFVRSSDIELRTFV